MREGEGEGEGEEKEAEEEQKENEQQEEKKESKKDTWKVHVTGDEIWKIVHSVEHLLFLQNCFVITWFGLCKWDPTYNKIGLFIYRVCISSRRLPAFIYIDLAVNKVKIFF